MRKANLKAFYRNFLYDLDLEFQLLRFWLVTSAIMSAGFTKSLFIRKWWCCVRRSFHLPIQCSFFCTWRWQNPHHASRDDPEFYHLRKYVFFNMFLIYYVRAFLKYTGIAISSTSKTVTNIDKKSRRLLSLFRPPLWCSAFLVNRYMDDGKNLTWMLFTILHKMYCAESNSY